MVIKLYPGFLKYREPLWEFFLVYGENNKKPRIPAQDQLEWRKRSTCKFLLFMIWADFVIQFERFKNMEYLFLM